MFADELSRRPGFFQSLDPRVKVVAVLELLISVSLSREAWVIAAIYLLALGLAWRSAISPGLLMRRVWLVTPLFTLPIVLPALFLTPGPPLTELPFGWTITRNGATAVLFLLLRVGSSLTLTLLLIYTTAWHTVLGALTSLRVPETFALVLGMTHRYIYLLLRVANDMLLSRQSRVAGQLSTADGQRLLSAAAGSLLTKSLKFSGDVYLAMQSRGFRHAGSSLRPFRMAPRDWGVLFAITLIAGVSTWLGQGGA
jgi:cobalt ECF transporter T component CbiQ